MTKEIIFDYYYGSQADQFSFYRLPKTLIKDKRFKKISSDAKILYGIMLDRMSLSIKNKWVDKENRVYIIFTLEEVMGEFECSERKAGYLMAELDTKSGVGLIEKKRQGLGKPNLIFLKNFQVPEDYSSFAEEIEMEDEGEVLQDQSGKNLPVKNSQKQQIQNGNYLQNQSGKNLQVKSSKDLQDRNGKNLQTKSSKDLQAQSGKNLQDQSGKHLPGINTNYNQTDYNEINPIYPSADLQVNHMDLMKEMQIYTEIVKENIEYECLMHDASVQGGNGQCIDEILTLIVETLCMGGDTIRIAGQEYPHQLVKSRLLKITHQHIVYVLGCLNQNTTKIKNIRSYLLTTLFNAPVTMNNYYRAEVNHDLYGKTSE